MPEFHYPKEHCVLPHAMPPSGNSVGNLIRTLCYTDLVCRNLFWIHVQECSGISFRDSWVSTFESLHLEMSDSVREREMIH
jgi:hypothetical protein